jgi:hypothetical protein
LYGIFAEIICGPQRSKIFSKLPALFGTDLLFVYRRH